MATPQQRIAEAERLRALGEAMNDQQKEQLDLVKEHEKAVKKRKK